MVHDNEGLTLSRAIESTLKSFQSWQGCREAKDDSSIRRTTSKPGLPTTTIGTFSADCELFLMHGWRYMAARPCFLAVMTGFHCNVGPVFYRGLRFGGIITHTLFH